MQAPASQAVKKKEDVSQSPIRSGVRESPRLIPLETPILSSRSPTKRSKSPIESEKRH